MQVIEDSNRIPTSTPTPSTPQPAATPTMPNQSSCCKDKSNCSTCLKGGMPMKREFLSLAVVILVGVSTVLFVLFVNAKRQVSQLEATTIAESTGTVESEKAISSEVPAPKVMTEFVDLPKPSLRGSVSVESALASRRSRRVYSDNPVTQAELSQVLWSAQGITDEQGHRTAPSGRGKFPFTVYVVIRNVTGMKEGLYQYIPEKHQLGFLGIANAGELLTSAGVQENSQTAPVVIVLSAAYGKMVESYPNNAVEVTMLEGGHIGQNIYLQVEALEMSTVVTAGFDAKKVGETLKLDPLETIIYLVPFGHTGIEEPEE